MAKSVETDPLFEEFIMKENTLPGVDEAFEAFLVQELCGREASLADSTRLVARRQFYGTHYERLFPNSKAPPVKNGNPRKTRPRVPLDALESGQDLCQDFCKAHPMARRAYLTMAT